MKLLILRLLLTSLVLIIFFINIIGVLMLFFSCFDIIGFMVVLLIMVVM